jgi:hypothetical protein
MRKHSNLLPQPPGKMWSKKRIDAYVHKATCVEVPQWINDLPRVARERQAMLVRHSQGNAACTDCLDEYPRSCRCGGLIHADTGGWCSSEFGESYDLETVCDQCGKFTAETRYHLLNRPLDLSHILG